MSANLITGKIKYKFIEQKIKKDGPAPYSSYFIDKSIKLKNYTDDFREVNRFMRML